LQAFASKDRSRSQIGVTKLLLTAALIAVFTLSAWLVGGAETVVTFAVTTLLFATFYRQVDVRFVMRLHRARPIPCGQAGALYRLLEELARRAGLKRVPDLYRLPSAAPNAFSVGDHDHSAIALSDGSLTLFDWREVKGVLAHEVAHIANGDGYLSLFIEIVRRLIGTTALAGLVVLVAFAWNVQGIDIPLWIPVVLLAGPGTAFLLQRALSRNREFAADLRAVDLTSDPQGLASALMRIERVARNPWARLLGIGRNGSLPTMLQTHPETEERIRRLRAMKGTASPRRFRRIMTGPPDRSLPHGLLHRRYRPWIRQTIL